jgi:hypothetical protein
VMAGLLPALLFWTGWRRFRTNRVVRKWRTRQDSNL